MARRVRRPVEVSEGLEADYWAARHFGRLLQMLDEPDRDGLRSDAFGLDSWPERVVLAEEIVSEVRGSAVVDDVRAGLRFGASVRGLEFQQRQLERFERGDFGAAFDVKRRLKSG